MGISGVPALTQRVKIPALPLLIPSLAQWFKDLALLQLWRKLHLRLGFDPWPENFHMPWVQPKKKKVGMICSWEFGKIPMKNRLGLGIFRKEL